MVALLGATAGTLHGTGRGSTRSSVITAKANGDALGWWTSTEGGTAEDQRYSLTEAVDLAKRFDLVLALKGTFTADGLTPFMRAANPGLRLIVYSNGVHTQPDEAPGMNEAWFAHDPAGARVRNVTWGNWVMNPRSAGWRTYAADRCRAFMTRAGADGCYLDDLGVGNLTTNFSAVPVDPVTGGPYTEAAWIGATAEVAATVKAGLGGSPVFANALNHGGNYFGAPQSWRVMAAADGAEAEGFVRGDRAGVGEFRSEGAWRQDVDMLVDAGARGKIVLAKTKVWVPATVAVKNEWYRYALATFMLGTDGRSLFAFNARGPGRPEAPRAPESTDFGTPTEPYQQVNGVYRRRWTGGTVYVNPTSATVTVPIGGVMERLDGQLVTSLVLAPHTGDVLVPSTVRCDSSPVTIVGTAKADTISGTAGPDVILGLGGDDVINGGGGADVICGSGGADRVSGGAGDDRVIGGLGDDRVTGDAGNDRLDGQAGIDQLDGGAGSDACAVRPGDVLTTCELAG